LSLVKPNCCFSLDCAICLVPNPLKSFLNLL
jgi:hypothetical protein